MTNTFWIHLGRESFCLSQDTSGCYKSYFAVVLVQSFVFATLHKENDFLCCICRQEIK